MLRSLRLLIIPAAALALTIGCRGGGGDDEPGDPDARTDGNVVTGVTIQEVQSDAMVPGTAVTLRGKVVTAIDNFGSRRGNFYVAEEGGGEFSGVLVFGAPIDQVAMLSVGDKVDITGAEKDEFALESDPSGRTTTELVTVSGGMMTVTKVGTGAVPAPQALDALTIGQMPVAARDAELEKWEGVLVTLNTALVTRAIQPITSSGADDCDFREFVVTGEIHVDSSLAAIPATLPMSLECPAATDPNLVVRDDCVASITGMGDYFFSYKILPRTTADIVTGGTGCPSPENTPALCSDNIDNDGNGFTDCADFSCAVVPACVLTTTVVDVQNGTVPDGSNVVLNNVVVTGRSFNNRHVWVADALQAAPNNGVLVFRATAQGPLPAEIVVGARVNVTGMVDEFDGLDGGPTVTEVAGMPTVTLVSPPAGAPIPLAGVAIATAIDETAGEPYEGVLVQLTNVKVTGPLVPATGQRPMSAGAVTFLADDDMFRLTDADNTCYASLIGIWHYNGFTDTNLRVFLPRGNTNGATGDITTGGTCP